MTELQPPLCEFDDCDGPEEVLAVAVVPLVSTGMTVAYSWVLSCAECVAVWQAQPENEGRTPLSLVPTSELRTEHMWDCGTRLVAPLCLHTTPGAAGAYGHGGKADPYVREVTDWRPESTPNLPEGMTQ